MAAGIESDAAPAWSSVEWWIPLLASGRRMDGDRCRVLYGRGHFVSLGSIQLHGVKTSLNLTGHDFLMGLSNWPDFRTF